MLTDAWLNPVTGTASTLGYNERLEEFPHDLYSYYQSSIIEQDRKNGRLLYRYLMQMQQEWESIYGKILSVPDLLNPDITPEEALEYLKTNVAITDDLNYLWGVLDTLEKRRLIKFFAIFIAFRSTRFGIKLMFETMTGRPIDIRSYFYFRWLLSGESEFDRETAIGEEDAEFDPWLISEYHEAIGIEPDSVSLVPYGSNERYRFKIDSVVAEYLSHEDSLPEYIRITYRGTFESILARVVFNPFGSLSYYAYSPVGYYFDQIAAYSERTSDFRVGFEIDQYIFDINVMDDGSLNRPMVENLAKFIRPSHERIYIRYYYLIEKFSEENSDWEYINATLDEDENTVTLSDDSSNQSIEYVHSNVSNWSNEYASIRARNKANEKYFKIYICYQDSDNYIMLQVTPNTPPHIPAGTWELWEVSTAFGVTLISSGSLDHFDLDVYYVWHLLSVVEDSNITYQAYQDGELLISATMTPSPWTNATGTIKLESENGGEVEIDTVRVSTFPRESTYVGH